MTPSVAKPGRPRDPQADAAILAAARDLMAEGGLAGLTVEGTAAKAGVAKTTIYRRYPSKLDLAVAAVAQLIHHNQGPQDPEAAADNALDVFMDSLGSAQAQAAMLSVAAAAATDPKLHERFNSVVVDPARMNTVAWLRAYREKGQASENLDPDFYYDVVVGTLLHRLVIRRKQADGAFHRDLAKLMAYMLEGLPDTPGGG